MFARPDNPSPPDPSTSTGSTGSIRGGELTQLLHGAQAGSDAARETLLERVYGELLKIARAQMRHERDDHTLGATGLVNESYLRLFGRDPHETEPDAPAGTRTEPQPETPGGAPVGSTPLSYAHRFAFYKAASTAMRRILIDHARARASVKRAGGRRRLSISADFEDASIFAEPEDLMSLDDALARLEKEDERAATVVRLRFYAGRQHEEIAQMLDVSARTIKRDWEFARARLQQILEEREPDEPSSST